MKLVVFVLSLICVGSLQAGPWFKKSNFGGDARHRTTGFSIGNNGYLGLGHINAAGNVDYEDFWKYDPASDSWTQIANYAGGKCFHATAFVIGNKAYVGTGRLTTGTYTNQFFCYDPLTNTWTPIANFPGSPRRGSVAFAINGKGYVGTGQAGSGYTSDFFVYNPVTNTWGTIAGLPGNPRTSSVAFSIGNYGYVGTGNTNVGSSKDFYRYDPVTNQWLTRAPVGPTNRQEACGFAVNGKGYIGTGDDFSSGNNFGDFWEYEPSTDQWIQMEDFDGTARRYLSSFVIGSRAYVGTGTNGTNFRDFWMFDRILGSLELQMAETTPMLYPNPTYNEISLDLQNLPEGLSPEEIEIEMIDLAGSLKMKSHLEAVKSNFEMGHLLSGLYIIRLKYKGEVFYTSKIMKT